MERSQILEAMGELKLYGMRGAYDEIRHRREAAARAPEGSR